MPRQKYTLADVANEAGVSVMTVSRVVNNKGEISEETRKQVQSVIDRLRYRPNRAARSLVTRRTYAIGIVVPDITNPFFANIVRGVEDEAWEHGYNMLLNNTVEQTGREEAALQLLYESDVEGLVVCSPRLPDNQLHALLEAYESVVVINRRTPPELADTIITSSDGLPMQLAHMSSAGYTRLAMIYHRGSYLPDWNQLETMVRHFDVDLPPSRVFPMLPTWESGYRTVHEQHANLRRDGVNGLICSNDLVAMGALQACKELGIRVPQDIAIIGSDDIPAAAQISPSLTTLRSDQYKVGRTAMQRLLTQINEENLPVSGQPVEFPLQLIIRESAPTHAV